MTLQDVSLSSTPAFSFCLVTVMMWAVFLCPNPSTNAILLGASQPLLPLWVKMNVSSFKMWVLGFLYYQWKSISGNAVIGTICWFMFPNHSIFVLFWKRYLFLLHSVYSFRDTLKMSRTNMSEINFSKVDFSQKYLAISGLYSPLLFPQYFFLYLSCNAFFTE